MMMIMICEIQQSWRSPLYFFSRLVLRLQPSYLTISLLILVDTKPVVFTLQIIISLLVLVSYDVVVNDRVLLRHEAASLR